jgi:hypothetical protein
LQVVAKPTLDPGAEKLFEFKGYDFGDILGTSVVSFGKKGDNYISLLGDRASDAGWQEESFLWAFPKEIEGVSERKIRVSRLQSANLIRMSLTEEQYKLLFSFYAA